MKGLPKMKSIKFFEPLPLALGLIISLSALVCQGADSMTTFRMPSSLGGVADGFCVGALNGNVGTTFRRPLQLASEPKSGLTQAKLTTVDGEVLREGAQPLVLDQNQVLSFSSRPLLQSSVGQGVPMVQGTPTEVVYDTKGNPAYVIFAGQPVRLLELANINGQVTTREISGQGFQQHSSGFSTPLGTLKGWNKYLSEISISDLQVAFESMTDSSGVTTLNFESGVIVRGIVEGFTGSVSKGIKSPLVITFKKGTCKVTIGNRVLFAPSWGPYDMIVGNTIGESNSGLEVSP